MHLKIHITDCFSIFESVKNLLEFYISPYWRSLKFLLFVSQAVWEFIAAAVWRAGALSQCRFPPGYRKFIVPEDIRPGNSPYTDSPRSLLPHWDSSSFICNNLLFRNCQQNHSVQRDEFAWQHSVFFDQLRSWLTDREQNSGEYFHSRMRSKIEIKCTSDVSILTAIIRSVSLVH